MHAFAERQTQKIDQKDSRVLNNMLVCNYIILFNNKHKMGLFVNILIKKARLYKK